MWHSPNSSTRAENLGLMKTGYEQTCKKLICIALWDFMRITIVKTWYSTLVISTFSLPSSVYVGSEVSSSRYGTDLCAHPSPVLTSWAHRGYTCLVLPLNPDSPLTLCSWNHGIPCPKSFKPATRDYTIPFPRSAFLRVDCTTVYVTPGPREGQGWLFAGVRTQLKCVPFMVQNWAWNMRQREDRPTLPTLSCCRGAENLKNSTFKPGFLGHMK